MVNFNPPPIPKVLLHRSPRGGRSRNRKQKFQQPTATVDQATTNENIPAAAKDKPRGKNRNRDKGKPQQQQQQQQQAPSTTTLPVSKPKTPPTTSGSEPLLTKSKTLLPEKSVEHAAAKQPAQSTAGTAKLPAKTTAENARLPLKTATESQLTCRPPAKTTARKCGIKKLLAAVDRYSTEVTEALEAESAVRPDSREQKESLTLPRSEEKPDTAAAAAAAAKDLPKSAKSSPTSTSADSNHSREQRLVANECILLQGDLAGFNTGNR